MHPSQRLGTPHTQIPPRLWKCCRTQEEPSVSKAVGASNPQNHEDRLASNVKLSKGKTQKPGKQRKNGITALWSSLFRCEWLGKSLKYAVALSNGAH